MKDGTRDNEQHPESESGREFAARRTVIKGLVSAVPVVLTVSGGEALAQTSSYQCITSTVENGGANGVPECIDGNDEWYRNPSDVDENGDPFLDANGNPVTKQCLVYVDAMGVPRSKAAGGMPFTLSCHMSFT